MTEKITPVAYLFSSGNAAFFGSDSQQMPKLQAHGWKGLHQFIEIYPNAKVHIQEAYPLESELVNSLIVQIAKPEKLDED